MRIMPNGQSADWTQKIAFPVPRTREDDAAFLNEGIVMTDDPEIAETDVTQQLGKTIVRGIHSVSLPRIMYPSSENVIEIEGQAYYVITISEPKPKKNPEGAIYLLNLSTGETIRRPFAQYADKLNEVRREKVLSNVTVFNDEIQRYNKKVDRLNSITNPSTWPLQLARATEIVDTRVAELTAQEEAFANRLDQSTDFSPSMSTFINKKKDEIKNGIITNEQDLLDTLIFIHYHDPDAIQSLLSLPVIPDAVKTYLNSLISAETSKIEEKEEKTRQETGERKSRVEDTEAPTDYELIDAGEASAFKLDDSGVQERMEKVKLTPDRYFSTKGRSGQSRAVLTNIRRDKTELTDIRNSLDGLRDYVGRLGKGERGREVLKRTDKGKEILDSINEFAHKIQAFMRRYKDPVFITDDTTGQKIVNPKLFGFGGGKGNGAVAVVLNQIYSMLMTSIKEHSAQEPVLQGAESVQDVAFRPEDLP